MGAMLLTVLTGVLVLGGGSQGAEQEMLCTPTACFMLHVEPVRFHQAQNRCEHDGGYLVTPRGRGDEQHLRSLLSGQQLRFWIGLKLSRGDCVRPDTPLRGFRWLSGGEDSQFSSWKREPVSTCTEERCVTVDFSGREPLSWTPAGCRMKASYVCAFYFQGMCKALTLLGPGKIIYEAVFSKLPLKSELELLPFGTRAQVFCGARELAWSLCLSEGGAYRWTRPGPFCAPQDRSCHAANGGCEHECQEEAEAVRCSCREGYELDEDGFSCRTGDGCRPGACQHRCVPQGPGFSCQCPSGFQLSDNQRDCSDVDECRRQACGGHGCVNTAGGYRCECRRGYRASRGACRDVDECETAPCEHRCTNSPGSFSCSCPPGSRLSGDGRSCLSPPQPPGSGAPPPHESEALRPPEGLGRTTVEPQQPPPPTEAPAAGPVNATAGERNASRSWAGEAAGAGGRVLTCVLGAALPLLALLALTLFIAIFPHRRASKQGEKKKSTADGYCWVSSGLDPRLEKLYESILTDDL